MTINGSNLTIQVTNMDRSVSFYQSIGFTLKNRWGNHYAQLTASGMTIGLHPAQNTPGNSGNVSIGFSASDFESTKTKLQKMGADVIERKRRRVTISSLDRSGWYRFIFY